MKVVITPKMFSLADYLSKTHIYINQFLIVKMNVLTLPWWHYSMDQTVIAVIP